MTLCHLPVCWNFSSWSKQSYFKHKKWFYTNCGPLRLACFLKLLEPMEIALFQQDFVVAAYLSIEKIVVLRLSTYFLKLLKTIKTTLFQQEFVIPFSCMEIILNQFWPFPDFKHEKQFWNNWESLRLVCFLKLLIEIALF